MLTQNSNPRKITLEFTTASFTRHSTCKRIKQLLPKWRLCYKKVVRNPMAMVVSKGCLRATFQVQFGQPPSVHKIPYHVNKKQGLYSNIVLRVKGELNSSWDSQVITVISRYSKALWPFIFLQGIHTFGKLRFCYCYMLWLVPGGRLQCVFKGLKQASFIGVCRRIWIAVEQLQWRRSEKITASDINFPSKNLDSFYATTLTVKLWPWIQVHIHFCSILLLPAAD